MPRVRKAVRELIKRYNGSAKVCKPSKSSKLSLDKICNTAKMSKGMSLKKLLE